VGTSDKLKSNKQNIGKALQRNHGSNISMFYSNFPSVKQRDHCIYPLSNNPFHGCIGEIQVLRDDHTGNPKKVSCGCGLHYETKIYSWD
jgi:hypothetical protein